MEKRPIIKIIHTPADKLLEALGWFALLLLWAFTLYNYKNLPKSIPIHFNISGTPDDFGSRTTILLYPAVGTVLFVGMTILNKYPHLFNFPKRITAENALKQYTLATRLIRYLKLIIPLTFLTLVYMTYTTAINKENNWGIWFFIAIIGLIIIPLAYVLIQSIKAK